jgi:hypothetical protein
MSKKDVVILEGDFYKEGYPELTDKDHDDLLDLIIDAIESQGWSMCAGSHLGSSEDEVGSEEDE